MTVAGFGRRLQRTREELGWSQRRLALEIGTRHSGIAGWEAGRVEPGIWMVEKLACALDVRPEWLAYGPDEAG